MLFQPGAGSYLIDLAAEGSPRQVQNFLKLIEQNQQRDLKTIRAKIESKANVPIGSLSIRSTEEALKVAENQVKGKITRSAAESAEKSIKQAGVKMIDNYLKTK